MRYTGKSIEDILRMKETRSLPESFKALENDMMQNVLEAHNKYSIKKFERIGNLRGCTSFVDCEPRYVPVMKELEEVKSELCGSAQPFNEAVRERDTAFAERQFNDLVELHGELLRVLEKF